MPSGHDLDLQIMLEIVRYVSNRPETTDGVTLTLTQVLQNLPPGATIGTIIGAIVQPEEVVVGDTYKTGQAAAVGPGAVAFGNTFKQTWIENAADIDLGQLAAELRDLRAAAKAQSSGDVDQDLALGALASAEKAALAGDGPTVLSHLRDAGRWILEVATSIGVPIAIKAIQTALGIPA